MEWSKERYGDPPIVRLFAASGTLGVQPTPGGSMPTNTGNTTPAKSTQAKPVETTDTQNPATHDVPATASNLVNQANPTGATGVSTGQVGDPEVIQGQEHVLGDDPRRIAATQGGFHDSLSGRQVTADGKYADGTDGEVPKHRIVANDWPNDREKLDDPSQRAGNDAPSK